MRILILVAAAGLLVFVANCRSALPVAGQCTLTISLPSGAFETASEADATFGPSGLTAVLVFEPGPTVSRVNKLAMTETAKLTSTSTIVPSPRGTTRLFTLDTGLWTTAWDQVAWRDANGLEHIPPGWYQIEVVYLPAGSSGNTACKATSPPFQVRREALWQRDDSAPGPTPPKAPSP